MRRPFSASDGLETYGVERGFVPRLEYRAVTKLTFCSLRCSGLERFSGAPERSHTRSRRNALLIRLALFWRIGRALKAYAVTVGISQRYHPQAVSNEWTFLCLYSA